MLQRKMSAISIGSHTPPSPSPSTPRPGRPAPQKTNQCRASESPAASSDQGTVLVLGFDRTHQNGAGFRFRVPIESRDVAPPSGLHLAVSGRSSLSAVAKVTGGVPPTTAGVEDIWRSIVRAGYMEGEASVRKTGEAKHDRDVFVDKS